MFRKYIGTETGASIDCILICLALLLCSLLVRMVLKLNFVGTMIFVACWSCMMMLCAFRRALTYTGAEKQQMALNIVVAKSSNLIKIDCDKWTISTNSICLAVSVLSMFRCLGTAPLPSSQHDLDLDLSTLGLLWQLLEKYNNYKLWPHEVLDSGHQTS